jgi:hypothetical protein
LNEAKPALPKGAAAFFKSLPENFRAANQRQWELYEETLYLMHRPVTHGNLLAINRYIGGYTGPRQALLDHRVHDELNDALQSAEYPDASVITLLDPYVDGSMEFAAALLHFNNPAYPLYDAGTVSGLQELGFSNIRYLSTLEGDSVAEYQKYVNAIQVLKEAAPYQAVPEKNYYLTRIIQEGLWQLGHEHPAPEARNRPKPTLR